MFSKKATKIEKNLHRRFDTYCNVKSMVKISSIFVAFLENMNFIIAAIIGKTLLILFWFTIYDFSLNENL